MDLDGSDLVADAVEVAAAFAGVVLAGDLEKHIHAVDHLAEYQEWRLSRKGRRRVCYEEL